MKKVLFIFGTRPEAIKLAPLIYEFQKNSFFKVGICVTGQHQEMLDQVLNFFKLKPDDDLRIMTPDQSLFQTTSRILSKLEEILIKTKPDLVIVLADPSTAFCAALASFYKKIPVAHIEAGLRSNNKYAPFPEEINRKLISHLADYHFTPTKTASDNLKKEGLEKNVYLVGNTVIDALHLALKIIETTGEQKYRHYFSFIDFTKEIILVTGHRRENFGKPIENIARALKEISKLRPQVEIIYPVHLNPKIRIPVFRLLKNQKNIHLIDPLDYPRFLWLMKKAKIILTDSGGIQEEAPALGKPVLVMREVTERPEGIKAGTAKLVGTDKKKIVAETLRLLDDKMAYGKMARAVNPYGDGQSSQRIVKILQKLL